METMETTGGKGGGKRDGVTVQEEVPTVTVTVHPDYRLVSDEELEHEIKASAAAITAHRVQMNKEMRERLLPALLELKERTYRKTPGFYETLEKMGLNPDTVRQWFYRSNTADEIIAVLEDEENPRESNDWGTPPNIVEAVKSVLGGIDLDPASSDVANQTVQATNYYTQNGLEKPWEGRVFLNPPYRGIAPWIEKLVGEYRAGNTTAAIALLPNYTESGWFHSLNKFPICFIRGNVRFLRPDGKTGKGIPPFQSVALYLGPDNTKFAEVFGKLGWIPGHEQKPRPWQVDRVEDEPVAVTIANESLKVFSDFVDADVRCNGCIREACSRCMNRTIEIIEAVSAGGIIPVTPVAPEPDWIDELASVN